MDLHCELSSPPTATALAFNPTTLGLLFFLPNKLPTGCSSFFFFFWLPFHHSASSAPQTPPAMYHHHLHGPAALLESLLTYSEDSLFYHCPATTRSSSLSVSFPCISSEERHDPIFLVIVVVWSSASIPRLRLLLLLFPHCCIIYSPV